MGYFVDTSEKNVFWLNPKMRFSFLLGAPFPLVSWVCFTSNTKSSSLLFSVGPGFYLKYKSLRQKTSENLVRSEISRWSFRSLERGK